MSYRRSLLDKSPIAKGESATAALRSLIPGDSNNSEPYSLGPGA